MLIRAPDRVEEIVFGTHDPHRLVGVVGVRRWL
jgi:hypothetical protein